MCYIFQWLDPKHTGHRRADDIPSALGDATCLYELFLEGFDIDVTDKERVYRDHPLHVVHGDDDTNMIELPDDPRKIFAR